MRRVILVVIGIALIAIGAVWLFQGAGVLPGSVMTGMLRWAVIGSLAVLIGIAVLIIGIRTGSRRSGTPGGERSAE